MAYSKTKTQVEEAVDTGAVENTAPEFTKSVVPKKKIPLTETVMVKNLTGGKLIYVSKRLQGYSEVWHEFGEEIPMPMEELYSMKNTDRRFFTENWIEVDIAVLRDLQMERFYKDAITYDEIQNLFSMDIDKIVVKIGRMSMPVKNCVGLQAMKMIEDRTLTDIGKITALEKALKCELYER